ncbi:hypothetical protein acdb102_13790 [Acidothermaceae bacterium B102]|nr:hypothetical protein acdb102_13790 [Acidothermaceae bacterium B102]
MTVRRTYARLATTSVAASLLMGTMGAVATSAQAATYPTITLAQAKTAIPAAKLLPASVKLTAPVALHKTVNAIPCLTVPKQVVLKGATGTGGDYVGKVTSPVSPKYIEFALTIAVFATPAKANAAAAGLLKIEKACPKTKTTMVKGATETWSRSLGTKYAVGAFKGYRSVEHLTVTEGAQTLHVRAYEIYLVRGNVLLSIEEVGGATAVNGKEQDAWRKKLTTLMVKRVSALK